jgi:hypothetical protein
MKRVSVLNWVVNPVDTAGIIRSEFKKPNQP